MGYGRNWMTIAWSAAVLGACQSVAYGAHPTEVDWLIENGTVFDGTGSEGRSADIAISAKKIVFVGDARTKNFTTAKRVDASGLIVAPGFIDPHTHAMEDLASRNTGERANQAYTFQGVTTVVVGNDGFGTTNIAEASDSMNQSKIGTNAAFLIGFGEVRQKILGEGNRTPTMNELAAMKALVKKGMCEGALGLSAGLYYAPQNFAKTAEVSALTKVVAKFGGIYDTHLRDESTYNIGVRAAVAEALDIGRQTGVPVHISHIKALGPVVWGASKDMIAMIESARAEGIAVTANQYPWTASGTRVSNALVPRWALAGGLPGLRERLADRALAERIRSEMAAGLKRRGGADKLLFTGSLGKDDIPSGITLAEYAAMQKLHPLDAAIHILKAGDMRVASFNMNETDINAFARQDWVVTGSDGSAGHPRKYASFPNAYRRFVTDGKLLSLARFIRRSSGQTADILGLTDRGYLKAGLNADVVIFDPEDYAPRATYEKPTTLSAGVVHLFVNGTPVISNRKATDALPGMALLYTSGARQTECSN